MPLDSDLDYPDHPDGSPSSEDLELEALKELLRWAPKYETPYVSEFAKTINEDGLRDNKFHSRHLAPSLRLRYIRRCSPLDRHLSQVVDDLLDITKSRNVTLPSPNELGEEFTVLLKNCETGTPPHLFYMNHTLRLASVLASSLLLTPSFEEWSSLPRTINAIRNCVREQGFAYSRDLRTIEAATPPPEPRATEILQAVLRSNSEYADGLFDLADDPRFVTQLQRHPFFEVETLLLRDVNVEGVVDDDRFPWTLCRTVFKEDSRHSQGDVGHLEDVHDVPDWWSCLPPSIGGDISGDEDTEAESEVSVQLLDFFQRAWMRAVLSDSTVLVLFVSDVEYICVRERSTGTLFISDPVTDPSSCDHYLKVHVGLFAQVLRDALSRKAAANGELPIANTSKRKAVKFSPTISIPCPIASFSQTQHKLYAEARTFASLHLFFRYGPYDSTVPSSMSRVESCGANDAMSLCTTDIAGARSIGTRRRGTARPSDWSEVVVTLISKLGEGAVGLVHHGIMRVPGSREHLDVAVKIGTSERARLDLLHELEAYTFLEAHNVQGVCKMIGLYRDDEDGSLALVTMHHGDAASGKNISPAQGASVVQTVKGLHRAGIVHGDINPSNLVMDSSGDVRLIDFHRSYGFIERVASRDELNGVVKLLAAKTTKPKGFSGLVAIGTPFICPCKRCEF